MRLHTVTYRVVPPPVTSCPPPTARHSAVPPRHPTPYATPLRPISCMQETNPLLPLEASLSHWQRAPVRSNNRIEASTGHASVSFLTSRVAIVLLEHAIVAWCLSGEEWRTSWKCSIAQTIALLYSTSVYQPLALLLAVQCVYLSILAHGCALLVGVSA